MDMNGIDVKKAIVSVLELCDENLEVAFRKNGGVIGKEYDTSGGVVEFQQDGQLFYMHGELRPRDVTIALLYDDAGDEPKGPH